MKKKLSLVAVLVGIAASGAAYAGKRTTVITSVDLTRRVAAGALGSARNSAGGGYVGCLTEGFASSADGFCWAQNDAGVFAVCSTTNSNMLAAMRSVTVDSRIDFQWDTSTHCTYVAIDNSSYNEPKQP